MVVAYEAAMKSYLVLHFRPHDQDDEVCGSILVLCVKCSVVRRRLGCVPDLACISSCTLEPCSYPSRPLSLSVCLIQGRNNIRPVVGMVTSSAYDTLRAVFTTRDANVEDEMPNAWQHLAAIQTFLAGSIQPLATSPSEMCGSWAASELRTNTLQ